MTSRIPPLLEPCLALPPEASLILLTSVLGASSNWLVLRFLYNTLLNPDARLDVAAQDEPKAVLVSFMRDLAFWKENARRIGLDLDKLAAKKRFVFVDGLSGLFLPTQQKLVPGRGSEKTLSSPQLDRVSVDISEAVRQLKAGQENAGKILLVIDQLDLLLAASGDKIDAVALGEMLVGLREVGIIPHLVLLCRQKQEATDNKGSECTRNNCHTIGRLSTGFSTTNTSGNQSRSILTEYSTSGRFSHEFEAVRHRYGKGC